MDKGDLDLDLDLARTSRLATMPIVPSISY